MALEWRTEKKKVTELKYWEKNPHKPTAEEMKTLEKNLKDLGNFEPLVIDTDNTVLAGNKRLRLAIEKEQEEIEVNIPSRKLTEKEREKIGLLSNIHRGKWDFDMIKLEFEKITLEEVGFEFIDLIKDSELPTKNQEDNNKLVSAENQKKILITFPKEYYNEDIEGDIIEFIKTNYPFANVKKPKRPD